MDVKMLSSLPPWEWPADAGQLLLSALETDTREDPDRLLAVELAGSTTVMNDDLAQALLAIVRDPGETETIRGRAAISLGPTLEELDTNGFDDPEELLVSEGVAQAIRDGLREVYLDAGVPKDVRRRALEASVRAEEGWHPAAVRAAYDSGDDEWKLTAVFCMCYVAGFDREIVEALESNDPAVRYHAVRAAGNWAVEAAWPRIRALVSAEKIDKPLLLAAIEAVAGIRPREAGEILAHLTDAEDDEIADAVSEALAIAGPADQFDDLDDRT
jgi:hypothetical protein